MSRRDADRQADLHQRLIDLIPPEEMRAVCGQACSEISPEWDLGALHVYEPLSHLIPVERVVLDLGCYLAAQSYFFADHRGYIGVDQLLDHADMGGTGELMIRFTPPNATHYDCSIQDFIAEVWPTLGLQTGDVFAVCSYVPDEEAVALARSTFSDLCVYYPSEADIAPLHVGRTDAA